MLRHKHVRASKLLTGMPNAARARSLRKIESGEVRARCSRCLLMTPCARVGTGCARLLAAWLMRCCPLCVAVRGCACDVVASQSTVLLSTDIASRGLDIQRLSHVVQLCPPKSARQYLHRAGRVGRQGRSGTVVTVACSAGEVAAMTKLAASLGIHVQFARFKQGELVPVSAADAGAGQA